MTSQLKLGANFDSLNKVFDEIKRISPYEASMVYDIWDMRTDSKGQMEKCVLLKKNNMHGVKLHLEDPQTLRLTYVIPNKILNAYFGKSQKRYKNILEILTEKIASVALAGSQKNAFDEIAKPLNKLSN